MTGATHRSQTGFIPALDGLRGIAILMVLFHHFTIYRPSTGLDAWIANVPLAGWAGVNLFFVLSGFLITGILLDTRGGAHYFRNFYVRRSLRIFPLYYVVVFLALILLPLLPSLHEVLVGDYPAPPQWPYWTYLTNFSVADRGMTHGLLDIAWSLAIEEQFYLVWALVVWFLPLEWLGPLCVAILVGEPLARTLALGNGVAPETVYVLTFFRLDGLAAGALLAWLLRRGELAPLDRWTGWTFAAAVAGVIAITIDAGNSWWWNPRMQQAGFSLIAMGASSMVVAAVTRSPHHLVPRLLSLGWLRAFGKYSYCLYLTHLPIMRAIHEYVFDPREYASLAQAPWLGQGLFYVSVMVPSFALAWISWRVFEAPILRLKTRFPN